MCRPAPWNTTLEEPYGGMADPFFKGKIVPDVLVIFERIDAGVDSLRP